jgi:hypothetical protein
VIHGLNLSAGIAHRQRCGNDEKPDAAPVIGARPDAAAVSTFAEHAPVTFP